MIHTKRRWCRVDVETPEALAEHLTEQTWTLCTGFALVHHPGLFFLNDSLSEDGAQEYAVVRPANLPGHYRQIESITFSWCSLKRALSLITETIAGRFDGENYGVYAFTIESLAEHGRCHLCT